MDVEEIKGSNVPINRQHRFYLCKMSIELFKSPGYFVTLDGFAAAALMIDDMTDEPVNQPCSIAVCVWMDLIAGRTHPGIDCNPLMLQSLP